MVILFAESAAGWWSFHISLSESEQNVMLDFESACTLCQHQITRLLEVWSEVMVSP